MARVGILLTGFTPFPGAPVNPTEHLVRHFKANPPSLPDVEFRFGVLPVDYAAVVPALATLADGFDPDIAIHFGLANEATGFRLETTARNAISSPVPDNADRCPTHGEILAGANHHASTLPLDAIAADLRGRGLPVALSDDAGGYLCNYVFYHSAAGMCRGFPAPMTGFVHVPPVALPGAADPQAMTFEALVEGAVAIIAACFRHFPR